MAVRVLIVDDESLARDNLRLLLEERDGLEIVGESTDGAKAVHDIHLLAPDIVFLDVQMPEMTGFEVVEQIGAENMPVVVFATAYDEYALRAFEAHALDYLLKPYDDDRFENVLNRALDAVEQKKLGAISKQLISFVSRTPEEIAVATDSSAIATESKALDRIIVKDRGVVTLVQISTIDWIESAGDYVQLHTGDKKHVVRDSMSSMEEKLDKRQFIRIHRGAIVNIDRVKELKTHFHGDYIVYLDTGKELKLSRRYWKGLEQRLNG